MRQRFIISSKKIFLFFSFVFYSINATAQCAMCRAAVESEGSNVKAEALNDGIVYLMVVPYLLIGIIGYVVYKMYSKKKV